MATQAQVDALKARATEIQRRIGFEESLVRTARANLRAAEEEVDRLSAAARPEKFGPTQQVQFAAAISAAEQAEEREKTARTRLANETRDLESAQSQLSTVNRQIQEAEQALLAEQKPTAATTAADEVKENAADNPAAAATSTLPGPGTPPADSNTNPQTVTAKQSQGITGNSNSGNAVPAPPKPGESLATNNATPSLAPGAAAKNDDAQQPATAAQTNADSTTPTIVPQPNVLDDFFNYTYTASVYMIRDEQYRQLMEGNNTRLDSYQLLFKTGGAPNNKGGERSPGFAPAENPADAGRSPFFNNDFYIDTIKIKNLVPGKGSGASHSITEVKFTVIEPNGISLLQRLYDAVANLEPTDAAGKVNYASVNYLMVIRFWGYDQYGNPVEVKNTATQTVTGQNGVLVEKLVPFRIRNINWSVGDQLVSYEWDCLATPMAIAATSARGTIPYDVQLVDSTVGGLLGGAVKYKKPVTRAPAVAPATNQSEAESRRLGLTPAPVVVDQTQSEAEARRLGLLPPPSAPAKANAAPSTKNTLTSGLIAAMNEFQQQLVKKGVFTYADEYAIEFVGPDAEALSGAKLQLPNAKTDKRSTASGKSPTQDAKSLDQRRTSVDMLSKSFSITAGQQMLQVIDMVIRNSSYITDQSLVIVNPDGSVEPNPNSREKPLKWFNISMRAVPISPLDPKRNDKAYKITYSVQSRVVDNVLSKYFAIGQFRGVVKSYPYWFTGKNIAVLSYKEKLNHMYQLTVSGSNTEFSQAAKIRESETASMSDIMTYTYSPRSTESSQGAQGKSNEAGANAAEMLYSPNELAECKLKIVGDPAWILQGSTAFRQQIDADTESLRTGFLPDGTIQVENQDALFEIVWQRPQDYDLLTGLADPNNNLGQDKYNRVTSFSRVYICKEVESDFNKGSFEQTLTATLYTLPVPSKKNTANPAAANSAKNASGAPNQSDAETARLNRQAVRAAPDQSDAETARLNRQNAAANPRRGGTVAGTEPGNTATSVGGAANPTARTAPTSVTGSSPTGSYARGQQQSLANLQRPSPAGPVNPATSNNGTVVENRGSTRNAPLKLGQTPTVTGSASPANQRIAKD